MAGFAPTVTTYDDARTHGLGPLAFEHPPGTFAPTPASEVALEAVCARRELLGGCGIDWGCGIGLLAIAAARAPGVEGVLGLDVVPANVAASRANAARNRVADRARFLLADSFSPVVPAERGVVGDLAGELRFVLANPPASVGDDGFGFRRVVLAGALDLLAPGGVVLLMISVQYGRERIARLAAEAGGGAAYEHLGAIAGSEEVPFDLGRPDLLGSLRAYVLEERRGGLPYEFPAGSGTLDAHAALERYERTGRSPVTRWQVHLFRRR